MQKSKKLRARSRRDTNRRNFLRLERLEDRMVLTGAAPIAFNDSFHTLTDQPLDISPPGILSNDTDAEGDALSAILFSGPAHGTLTMQPDGGFHYAPEAGFTGIDSFMYSAADDTSCSRLAAVTIRVGNGGVPTSQNDSFTVNEDNVLNIPAPAGVLHNDSDPDGDPMTAALVTGPTNGTVELASDGSFVYTPSANFHGSDSFVYQASDGTGTGNEATVTITVNSVNDVPTASNDAFGLDEDTPLTISAPGIMENDSDADGDSLTPSIVSNPIHGSITLGPDGSFTYTPAENFHGVDGFSYLVSDGTATSNVATVTLEVNSINDKPVGAADEYTTAEDTALTIDAAAGVMGNDTDADGDSLIASLVSGPSHGTLTLNSDGSFSYTPEANFNGADSFSYTVNDGTIDSDPVVVTLNVTPVNDNPIAVNDEYTIDEDTTLNLAAPGILGNDTDVDGDTLAASLVSGPIHGTLSMNPDGSLTYTPEANFNGTDGFSYVVNDGAVDSEVATVTINVNAVNDTPVAVNDDYTTQEDTPLTLAAPGILGNDTDADGDALAASLVSGPIHGSLTLNPDGSLTYTPEANFNGTDGFSYMVSDGSADSEVATVTINVTPVEDAPTAVNDEYATDEDTPLAIDATSGLLANDSDPDSSTLTVTMVSGPVNGTVALNPDGSFNYVPNADYNGTDGFSYTVSDGSLESDVATVTINVNPIDDAPVAENDSFATDEDTTLTVDAAAGVLANDSDVEGDSMTAALVTGPAHGSLTLNVDGSFSYTPEANWSGEDSFVYSATDGSLSSEATVTITVNSANDSPVAAGDEYSVDEDANLHVDAAGVLANDTDADGDTLSAILVTGPANGTLTLNTDGSFDYAPTANFNGSDSFVYKANDGQADSAETTVTITVNSVNDAPTAEADSYTTDEDVPLTVSAPGVLGNDSDIEGDPLSAILGTGPAHGTVSLAADGSLVYTPEANFNGSDSFTYKVSDGSLESAETTVSITVNPIADAPLEHSDAYSTGEDVPLNVAADMGVLANDFDPLELALTAELVTGPTNGTLTLNADGSFLYTPNANFYGSDSFIYVANNGVEAGPEMTATIVVQALNDAPSAVNDTYSLTGSGSISVDIGAGVMANDSDIDGDALTATMLLGPSHGSITLNSDGSFTYVAAEGFTGNDSFKYQVNDGMANSNVATVWLNYAQIEENSPPTSQDDAYSVDAGSTLDIVSPGVLGNDSDADGDPLTAALLTGPAHGALTLNVDGSFSYTPEAGFAGEDSFTYMASDGIENGNVSTVILTVQDVSENQIPDAKDDGYVAEGGTLLSVSESEGVLANDTDADGDPLTAVLVDGAAHGTLTLNADGSFDYQAEAGFNGTDTFTYQASDGTGLSPVATVSIEVTSTTANQRPVAVNDQFTTTVDQPLTVASPGLLGNDSDADGDSLTVQLFSGPQNGTLTINGDGSFVYTPAAGFQGRDSFIYRVSDGEMNSALAAVTIYVNAVPPGSIVSPGDGSSCGHQGEGEGDAPAQLRLASTLRSGEFDWLSDDGDLDESLLDDLAGKPEGEFGDIDSVLANDGWLL